jgi:hypothetical protein
VNSGKKIHDSLFKDPLSYPSEAEKLIKAYTNPAILDHIDWSTLEISMIKTTGKRKIFSVLLP